MQQMNKMFMFKYNKWINCSRKNFPEESNSKNRLMTVKKVYIYFDFHSQQGFQHVHILFIACYQLPYFCSWLSHFYQSSKKSRGVSKTWCHETKLGQFEPNTLSIFVIEWNPMILIDFFLSEEEVSCVLMDDMKALAFNINRVRHMRIC